MRMQIGSFRSLGALLVAVCLVVVVGGAGAMPMAPSALAVPTGATAVGDGDGCCGGNGAIDPACPMICGSLTAIMPPASGGRVDVADFHADGFVPLLVGRESSPEPHPPKPLLII